MLVHRTKILLIRVTCVGLDISYFNEHTEQTLIRAACFESALFEKALKGISMR